MKHLVWIFLICILIGCASVKNNVIYRQSTSMELVDSVAYAEEWSIPHYKNWTSSVYLGVANGDTSVIRVYNFWEKRNKQMFIFSITEINDTISQVNFRKE